MDLNTGWLSCEEKSAWSQSRFALKARLHAERAKLSSEHFLSGLNHAVNTPLHGVQGRLEALLETSLSSTQMSCVEDALDRVHNLSGLIHDVLDYWRIESGALTLNNAPFNLEELIEQCCAPYREQARAMGIQFSVCFPETLPKRIVGDATRIAQVITNVLNNAFEHTLTGQIALRLALDSQESGRCRFRVQIDDTGSGVPAEILSDIFERVAPGKHLHNSQGAGLGLVLCKQLMILMEGDITLVPGTRRGSSVTLTMDLPVAQSLLQDISILLVERDDLHRVHLLAALAAHGISTKGVASNEDALATLIQENHAGKPFQGIVLDGQGDPINAQSLCVSIKSDPGYAGLYTLLAVDDCAGECEGDGLIQKPVSGDALLARLNHWRESQDTGVHDEPCHHSEISRRRILVVDDDVINRKVAETLLAGMGCACEFADDGEDALLRLHEDAFDLVLMDCQMPGMNGFEVTQHIRRNEEPAHHLPIVGWSACSLQDIHEEGVRAGMDMMLSKPLKSGNLSEVIQRCLGLQTPQSAISSKEDSEDELAEMKLMFGDDYTHLAQLFSSDSPKRITQLKEALGLKDAVMARKVAHALCGSAGAIGATTLAKLCHQLEIQLSAGLPHEPDEVIQKIEQAYARTQMKLQKMVRP